MGVEQETPPAQKCFPCRRPTAEERAARAAQPALFECGCCRPTHKENRRRDDFWLCCTIGYNSNVNYDCCDYCWACCVSCNCAQRTCVFGICDFYDCCLTSTLGLNDITYVCDNCCGCLVYEP